MNRRFPSKAGTERTIRASEVAGYVYCERAWSLERQGRRPAASAALDSGLAWHRRHGRRVLMASGLRLAGWVFLLLAAVTSAILVAGWL